MAADLGAYRKIHMFDVDVEGVAYRESDVERPGEDVVVAGPVGADQLNVGMSVCYDVRFPELYRASRSQGAGWSRCLPPSPSRLAERTGRSAAGPRDREPGVRPGSQPDRAAPSRTTTAGATRWS